MATPGQYGCLDYSVFERYDRMVANSRPPALPNSEVQAALERIRREKQEMEAYDRYDQDEPQEAESTGH